MQLAVGVLAGLTSLLAMVGIAQAFFASAKVLWFALAFDAVGLLAGVFGLLLASGRLRTSPGLALACLGGCVGVGALLGYVSVFADVNLRSSLLPFYVGRALLAVALMLAGAWAVLGGNARVTLPLLIKGLVLTMALPVAVGVLWQAGVLSTAAAWPGIIKVILIALGFVAFTVLASAGTHMVIRAFELGGTPDRAAREPAGPAEAPRQQPQAG